MSAKRRSPRARVVAALLPVLLVALGAERAAGYFEDVAVDSRGIAMGRSLTAGATDVGAYYWNPAGLAAMRRTQILLDYGVPFGVPDLSSNGVAAGGRWLGFGIAGAWHRLGFPGYGEDLFVLAAGKALPLSIEGHEVAIGAALKLGRVVFEPYFDPTAGVDQDFGSQAGSSLDLGLRWQSPWRVDVGWIGRDLLRPRYQFVAGTGGSRVPFLQELGATYRWRPDVTFTAGWSEIDASRASSANLGMEILFYDVFALRSGFSNLMSIPDATTFSGTSDFGFTGGVGIRHRGWHLDAAATTHAVLGVSYRASLRIETMEGSGR